MGDIWNESFCSVDRWNLFGLPNDDKRTEVSRDGNVITAKFRVVGLDPSRIKFTKTFEEVRVYFDDKILYRLLIDGKKKEKECFIKWGEAIIEFELVGGRYKELDIPSKF